MHKFVAKIERKILKCLRHIIYGDQLPPAYEVRLSGIDLNECIYQGLKGDCPFMACRFGSTEFENFSYDYAMRHSLLRRYAWYIKGWLPVIHPSVEFEKSLIARLCTYSGFFPNDIHWLSLYTNRVFKDMPYIDVLGVWNQEKMLMPLLRHTQMGALEDMEPYDYERPWSRALAGKKVLVIHPFAETIEKQYKKREHLWENPDVLPQFKLRTIKAVQSIAGEKVPFEDWFEALRYMEERMNAIDYDIAIIGCGAYGFHLAAHAKRMGKKAIHLGGATQILFGIKGKRWDERPNVNKFYNDYWVYPSSEETPKHKEKVENGCYW